MQASVSAVNWNVREVVDLGRGQDGFERESGSRLPSQRPSPVLKGSFDGRSYPRSSVPPLSLLANLLELERAVCSRAKLSSPLAAAPHRYLNHVVKINGIRIPPSLAPISFFAGRAECI